MPTIKQQTDDRTKELKAYHKEYKRCQEKNSNGDLICNMVGAYMHFDKYGKTLPGAIYEKRCRNHQLEGQVNGRTLSRHMKKLRPGKGASPKKKKLLKRKRSSSTQNSRSSSSASTTSSKDSYSTSDSNFSSRVDGNCFRFCFAMHLNIFFCVSSCVFFKSFYLSKCRWPK